jgi:DNA (cytosine-5)-methyltransferase 1
MIRFIDLFAGIGGLRSGFDRIDAKCVMTSEINKFALQTYKDNFSTKHLINNDISKLNEKDVPTHDILLAGFPCQPFSIAGVSKKNSMNRSHGFLDKTQGTLFFDILRILKEKRPPIFVLENVKNLKSHDKGNTFKVIIDSLQELNYSVSYDIVDLGFWLPQHRERVFIIGCLDKNFDFNQIYKENKIIKRNISDILHPENGSEDSEYPYTLGELSEVNEKYYLSDKLWSCLKSHKEKHSQKGNGFGYGLVDPLTDSMTRTLSARYHKDGSEILIKSSNYKNPRKLTPREASRLMGFDFYNNKKFSIPVSDTQAYKQFGNSVSPIVSYAIAESVKKQFL